MSHVKVQIEDMEAISDGRRTPSRNSCLMTTESYTEMAQNFVATKLKKRSTVKKTSGMADQPKIEFNLIGGSRNTISVFGNIPANLKPEVIAAMSDLIDKNKDVLKTTIHEIGESSKSVANTVCNGIGNTIEVGAKGIASPIMRIVREVFFYGFLGAGLLIILQHVLQYYLTKQST